MKNQKPDASSLVQGLLDQAYAGDADAIERLFRDHRAYLRRVVAVRLEGRLRSRMDASDIVQETEMVATKRLGDYLRRQPVPFRLWLRQIAQDRLVMAYRRHACADCRTVMREVPLPERSSLQLAKQLASSGPSPSQQAARAEQVSCIRKALGQLSSSDRDILLMRNYERLPYDEISYLLRIDPAAARKRYGRALLRLGRIARDIGLTESQI